MIEKGLMLMGVGMGAVFLYLTFMVCVMYITAAFFKKYAHLFPIEEAEVPTGEKESARIAVAVAVAQKFACK